MSLSELQKDIYDNAKEHGWWDKPRTFGDIVTLCHTELSEAYEEFRNGKGQAEVYSDPESSKPEGIPVEMADVIIRILDWAVQPVRAH